MNVIMITEKMVMNLKENKEVYGKACGEEREGMQ